MPNAIRFHKSGGPEVLMSEPVPISKPGPGEARVRHTAVGVNFVDIYIRTGLRSSHVSQARHSMIALSPQSEHPSRAFDFSFTKQTQGCVGRRQ